MKKHYCKVIMVACISTLASGCGAEGPTDYRSQEKRAFDQRQDDFRDQGQRTLDTWKKEGRDIGR